VWNCGGAEIAREIRAVCADRANVRPRAAVCPGTSGSRLQVLNDVVINQVLVSFGRPEVTREVIRRVQEDGTCWCGGTVWRGETAMRISVSSWATTETDVERSLQAIVRIAGACRSM